MTKFERWKEEEIKNIQEMTEKDFISQVINERYPSCCDYCYYFYAKLDKKETKCGKCSDGIKKYLEEEI